MVIHGSTDLKPSAFAAAAGFLACGTMAAAWTHFSAIFWRPASSVVVIRRPPFSMAGHVSASVPHSLAVSSSRTAHTKWGATQCGVCLASKHDLVRLRRLELGRGVLVAGFRRAALREQVEDEVSALDDRGVVRDHEHPLGRRAVVALRDRHRTLLDRVADEVVVRRRLGQPGDDRGLRRGDLREVGPEVGIDRRLHAVALVPVVVLVEVGGDDRLLALLAGEGVGQADRLDDLLELAFGGSVRVLDELRVEQACADELLGDRRSTTAVPADRAEPGRDDRDRIEAGVLPERLVLDGGRRIERTLGIWSKVTTSRRDVPNRASSTLPVRS